MTHCAKTLLFTISLIIASTASAAGYTDLYIVPAVGHAHGAHGTLWRSDLVLHNIQTVPIVVELALIESNQPAATAPIAIMVGGATTLHLNPGETRIVSDVVGNQGRDVAGSLIVGADLPFALTSRTYAESSSGKRLGQTVTPMAISAGSDAIEDASVLPGLTAGTAQRTNIGALLVASRAPLIAEIELVSASGTTLGSRLLVVQEPGFVHHQLSTADVADIDADASALIRIIEGDGVVAPYGSMIDNSTAEAIFVVGQPIAARGGAARAMLVRAVNASER